MATQEGEAAAPAEAAVSNGEVKKQQ